MNCARKGDELRISVRFDGTGWETTAALAANGMKLIGSSGWVI
jgi:hypothetical protein